MFLEVEDYKIYDATHVFSLRFKRICIIEFCKVKKLASPSFTKCPECKASIDIVVISLSTKQQDSLGLMVCCKHLKDLACV